MAINTDAAERALISGLVDAVQVAQHQVIANISLLAPIDTGHMAHEATKAEPIIVDHRTGVHGNVYIDTKEGPAVRKPQALAPDAENYAEDQETNMGYRHANGGGPHFAARSADAVAKDLAQIVSERVRRELHGA